MAESVGERVESHVGVEAGEWGGDDLSRGVVILKLLYSIWDSGSGSVESIHKLCPSKTLPTLLYYPPPAVQCTNIHLCLHNQVPNYPLNRR